ncbi:MAG: glycosyltransferase family 2 protein [Bacteroidia bacterium]|nr:glycosyltransferase family 2 protein [Bacteroidia bacterium]
MTMGISAVIITHNEQEFIGDCLKSLLPVVDEVVVLDSYSTDQTEQICASYPLVRFIQHEWQGYSKSKNHGNEIAKHQFILSLDADERLDQLAADHILKLKNSGTLQGAYRLKRKNYYMNTWIRYSGWYPDSKVRLFDRNLAQWKGDYVHETLVVDPRVEIIDLEGNIDHFTIKSPEDHIKTVEKYARLAAEKAISSGKKLRPLPSLLSAIAHFIKLFFIKLGVLHGQIGFRIAMNSARSKWLRYKYYKAKE